MAAINDLIAQIQDETLRDRIQKEVDRMAKQKKFGLVFEEHLPECTPLYDIPVKKGALVMVRGGDIKELYYVRSIADGNAECVKKDSGEEATFTVDSLVTVAQFGEPIYPFLKPIDSICNAPDSDLWHTLIEADNYHALQLLEYLYAGKVDCIYIDPPYNKVDSNDWKYNCNYVDSNDQYRHSKWLSMMEKRLKIAKKILNPSDSVLIVAIDEAEYLHLGCLLEELFPEAKIQMISSVVNHASIAKDNEFNRNNEYLFFVMIGAYQIGALEESKNFLAGDDVHWETLRRHNAKNTWDKTKTQFYPIFIETNSKKVHSVGTPLIYGRDRMEDVSAPEGCIAVFPLRDDGTPMMWGCKVEEFLNRLSKGYVRIASYFPNKPQQYSVQYLTSGTIEDIENGTMQFLGYNEDGSVKATYNQARSVLPKTQWDYQYHDGRDYGTYIIKDILLNKRFDYPKSLYAVHDAIRLFVANKPKALIVDFFAGSGTTLHAVNLLNAEDGGQRRCILVTNNEMKKEEEDANLAKGIQRGSDEWNALGIARYVTWPRTIGSIKGCDVKGNPLQGFYGYEKEEYVKCEGEGIGRGLYKKQKTQVFPQMAGRKMSDGFKANAAFFKLGFLDKTSVALGRQFKEMLPTLWMKAGAHGACPEIGEDIPDMLILTENRFAVLVDEKHYLEFTEELDKHPEIETVFIVTDSEAGYRDMIIGMEDKNTYQLYRDYLDNFRINSQRR